MSAVPALAQAAEPLFAPAAIRMERRSDGTIWLSSKTSSRLTHGVSATGSRNGRGGLQTGSFLAERRSAATPWQRLTYGDALAHVRKIGGWLLDQRLSVDRPLIILSENSIDHGVLMLAAMHVGVPVASISPAYSLVSKDFEKLRYLIQLLDPGAIYVSNTKPFSPALSAIEGPHTAQIPCERRRRSDKSDRALGSPIIK